LKKDSKGTCMHAHTYTQTYMHIHCVLVRSVCPYKSQGLKIKKKQFTYTTRPNSSCGKAIGLLLSLSTSIFLYAATFVSISVWEYLKNETLNIQIRQKMQVDSPSCTLASICRFFIQDSNECMQSTNLLQPDS
jgi:hypothetical protein